jgi:hypothetical protein
MPIRRVVFALIAGGLIGFAMLSTTSLALRLLPRGEVELLDPWASSTYPISAGFQGIAPGALIGVVIVTTNSILDAIRRK